MSQWKPDEEANRLDVVGGFTIPMWGGMNLREPPYALADNEFQLLENARWGKFCMAPRGGQEKFHPTAPTGDIYHFLWGVYGGCANHGGVNGIGLKDFPETAAYDPT